MTIDCSDETYDAMTQLQWWADFLRKPSGPGSEGGYARLYTSQTNPPANWTQDEKDAWLDKWRTVDGMPEVVRDYIASDLSIAELGQVTDIPDNYKRTNAEWHGRKG